MIDRQPIAPKTQDALRRVSTATLTKQLLDRGLRTTFLSGVRPMRPDLRMVGRAFTLRYVPMRGDIGTGAEFDNATNVQRVAIESIGRGEVLVIDARRETGAGSLGNILATRVMRRGAAGIVTDGALRDTPGFASLEMPSYAAASHAALSSTVHHPVEMNVPIGCAGVLVVPGDVVVGDAEGVVIVPDAMADEVAEVALEQEEMEAYILGRIEGGESIHGIYPPDQDLLDEYRRSRGDDQ